MVIVIFIIYIVVGFKNWIIKRDLVFEEKINKLNESLADTQSLFIKDVGKILGEFKKIINK